MTINFNFILALVDVYNLNPTLFRSLMNFTNCNNSGCSQASTNSGCSNYPYCSCYFENSFLPTHLFSLSTNFTMTIRKFLNMQTGKETLDDIYISQTSNGSQLNGLIPTNTFAMYYNTTFGDPSILSFFQASLTGDFQCK